MKKQITLLTAITLFIALTTNATVWRVNNRANVSADFTTLVAAISGASANDTIYLEGSPYSYGNGAFSKPLTLIGTGYFLFENDSTQAYTKTSKVGLLSFNSGSQGSVVEGLTITYASSNTKAVQINTSNITIRRNHITAIGGNNVAYYAHAIHIGSNFSSITIEQNWIEPTSNYDYRAYAIYFVTYAINSVIRNNIINCDTNRYAIYMGENNEASSLIIINNTIWGDITTYSSSHYSNILIYGTYTEGEGDLNSNNLCNATQYPNINGNQQNVDMSTVFEDYTNYIDNGYIIKAGSPAIGAGLLGVDCGAYGTNDPYMLSGMPPIPAIFDLEMSQTIGTTTIPVTVNAMSHK